MPELSSAHGDKIPTSRKRREKWGTQNLEHFSQTFLDRLAVGVDEVDFADSQVFDPLLDFGAVANDYPHHGLGMDYLFGDGVQVGGFQGADFAGHGFVIIVGPAVLQDVQDGESH